MPLVDPVTMTKPKEETETKAAKPKPCCVCLDEKAARDDCLIRNEDGETKCGDLISSYKSCMLGYGFKI
ncbi:cysteine alpha-hairpin motif superfamily [Dipodascopsis tothii]|uniref:cysteine alpha-hairpin motif superfamily n=1 Tax=Dipodascopsis tothii TaxID=44089 RepID=UPI0034CE62AF